MDLEKITDSTQAFLSLTLGEYLFDQWGGDWRKAVKQYSLMLDSDTAKQVASDLQALLDSPALARDMAIKSSSVLDFEVNGSSPEDYLRHAIGELIAR
jgi:hypothetical protein